MMKTNYSKIVSLFLFFVLMAISAISYALPYTVAPKAGTTLPTQITTGSTATALYTVTNITLRTLQGSYVKYFPQNVSQVTSDGTYPDLCGSTFNLASGGSCTLELTVSGAVNSADPDPHHHLFVCTANVPACAGTNSPLNVTTSSAPAATLNSIAVTPVNQTIAGGTTLQYTATGTYSDGSTQNITTSVSWSSSNTSAATIGSTTGLATGVAAGSATITATSGSISGTTTITVTVAASKYLYVSNISNSTVSRCDLTSGGASNCSTTGSGFSFSLPEGIVTNPAGSFAYITQGSQVIICSINSSTGTLSGCGNAGGSGFGTVQGATLSPSGNFIYVTSFSNFVTVCSVNSTTGLLSNCGNTTGFGSGGSGSTTGASINSATTFAYASNFTQSNVTVCAVDSTSGALSSCQNSGASGFTHPEGMGLLGSFVYITSTTNAVIKCTIDSSSGLLSSCGDSGAGTVFDNPQNIFFDSTGTFAYIPNRAIGTGTVSRCSVNSTTGALSSCTAISSATFNGPTGASVA